MTEAITQCPHCQTTFRVTEAQLRIADGSVRCGDCLHVFQAEQYFISPLLDKTERLAIAADYWADFDVYLSQVHRAREQVLQIEPDPEPASGPVSVSAPDNEIEADEAMMEDCLPYVRFHPGNIPEARPEAGPGEDSVPATISDEEEDPVDESHEAGQDDDGLYNDGLYNVGLYKEYLALQAKESGIPDADPVLIPAFELELGEDHDLLVRDRRRMFRARSLKWLPGIFLLLLGLAGQFIYYNIPTYSQHAKYRPAYEQLCRYMPCKLPIYDNAEELMTRELVIRSHPEEPEALLVDVLLRNGSPYRQQFPGLRLRFFDVRGDLVASRVFTTSEYLGGEMRGLKTIPAETEVRISLEVVDPGKDAVGYQMDVVRLSL